MYIQVKKGKPTMYQTGEREFHCKGLGQHCVGASMSGAYTQWKNKIAMADMSSMEIAKMQANVFKGAS